jgi:hypothetical protein
VETPAVPEPVRFEGLERAAGPALTRIQIRTRENAATVSAWRLAVGSAEGEGAILQLEIPGRGTHYRGEGVCLGWPQSKLALAYVRLRPQAGAPDPDPGQLG